MTATDGIEEFRALIERSSLGTVGARGLRSKAPHHQAKLLGRIVRHQDMLGACLQAGNQQGMLEALAGLAAAYRALGLDDEALALVPEQATIPQLGAAGGVWTLAARATVCQVLGRTHDAEIFCREVAFRAGHAHEGAVDALNSLADVFQMLSRHSEVQNTAVAILEKARREFTRATSVLPAEGGAYTPPDRRSGTADTDLSNEEGFQAAQAGIRTENRLLTPAEVAALFRVDPKTVTRWAQQGKLRSIRTLGGHRRYSEAEIQALLADSQGVPRPRTPEE